MSLNDSKEYYMSKKNDAESVVLLEDVLVDLSRPTGPQDKIAPIKTPEELKGDEVYATLHETMKSGEVKPKTNKKTSRK